MKILHTSDWHLGKTLENISRIEEQRQFIDELCDIAEKEQIDLVLIAGDIFDTYNPSSAAEELFYEAIDRLNNKGQRSLVIIAGNHDSPDRLCAASPLAYKNGVILLGYPGSNAGDYKTEGSQIKVIDSGAGWLELKLPQYEYNAVILSMPYPSESRLEEVITKASDSENLQQNYSDRIGGIMQELSSNFREDTVNLVISHLFMREGKISDSERQLGGALMVEPEAIPENAHYAALGHLHRPQQVKGCRIPTYYSGSPLAYSFSEVDYCKAVYIVTAEPGKAAEVCEINLNSGKPLKRWETFNGMPEALKWCEEGRDINAWIDLEIHTDTIIGSEEQKQLRELHPGIINIRPKLRNQLETNMDYKNRETKRIDELFREYYKSSIGMEASEELIDLFLSIANQDTGEESKENEVGGEEYETKIS
ncbi:MAG: Exodeoxyribonuclease subunit [Clostridia bacterium]|nr:Exodeoxyribonuclease subunit [Clostridia bacterium]